MNQVAATAADDSFHPPADPDPHWTETCWFGFSAPERRLTGALYPVFRPNLGICSVSVNVWDDTAENPHEVPYAKCWWHLPMPEGDLTDLELPNGLRYRTVEPLQRYEVSFRDEDLTVDLEYSALHPPHAPMTGVVGHLDQACHVTGTVTLAGETIDIDCHEMRDRSWSVRHDDGPVRAAYSYALSGDRCLLAMSMRAGDQDVVIAGYHLVDGEMNRVTGGTRTVERVDGRPSRVRLEVTDERGAPITAVGTCVNRFAFQSSPNYFAWMSLTDWEIDGTRFWGEDQDVWSPNLLRAQRRTNP